MKLNERVGYHIKPPLPFYGNKKGFLKKIIEVLDDLEYKGDIIKGKTIFFDIFGGSGLISNAIKNIYSKNEVIWNDFDNYKARLDIIEITEQIRQECFLKMELEYYNNQKDLIYLTDRQREILKDIINQYKDDELDFITLSTYFCFSSNYYTKREKFLQNALYNFVPINPLYKGNYLAGVSRVCKDFRILLKEARDLQERGQSVVIIADPPYINTEQGHYAKFTKQDYLFLLDNLIKPYIIFGSENSNILEYENYFIKAERKEAFLRHCKNKQKTKDLLFYESKNQHKHKGLLEYIM